MDTVNILIIDDDKASQSALQQVLDSEGWRVHIAGSEDEALQELSMGRWALVVANAGMTDVRGPLYMMLAELAYRAAARVRQGPHARPFPFA